MFNASKITLETYLEDIIHILYTDSMASWSQNDDKKPEKEQGQLSNDLSEDTNNFQVYSSLKLRIIKKCF